MSAKRWELIHGDCREVLPTLGQVDHVITDPPYDAKTHSSARTTRGGKAQDLGINFAPLETTDIAQGWLGVARRWVIAFCALEQLGAYRDSAGECWVRAGVWDRVDGMPQLSGDRPAQGAEGVAIMHGLAVKKQWNGHGLRGLWTCGVERGDRHHPTTKPLDLMLRLVELFTDPDDLVLDPFCGSGTTGVACLRLGRRFIGIERDEKYAAVARERLEAESKGLTLRDARAGQLPMFGGDS